jgi:hypothetical protein
VNIAVCSDNRFFNSKKIKNGRARYAYLQKELQSKGTKSAKRKLKRTSGKERRFAAALSRNQVIFNFSNDHDCTHLPIATKVWCNFVSHTKIVVFAS